LLAVTLADETADPVESVIRPDKLAATCPNAEEEVKHKRHPTIAATLCNDISLSLEFADMRTSVIATGTALGNVAGSGKDRAVYIRQRRMNRLYTGQIELSSPMEGEGIESASRPCRLLADATREW
jgi:hypothetical protein